MMIGFANNLVAAATESASAVSAQEDLRRLRDTAGEVVGNAFYGTLFQMMRDTKLKGAYGHGGRGEEVFSGQLHQRYAEAIGRSEGNALTELIFRSYAKQQRLIVEARQANDHASGSTGNASEELKK